MGGIEKSGIFADESEGRKRLRQSDIARHAQPANKKESVGTSNERRMKTISRAAKIGYPAGIITGITYGFNPMFAVPLMKGGAAIESILFFRYTIAVLLLGVYIIMRKEKLRITSRQAIVLLVLGLLYMMSSVFLFEAYKYIASGLATTLIFLYPVIVAIIMVFLGVVPSRPVWLSIVATFAGVYIMTQGGTTQSVNEKGVMLSLGSAIVYGLFIVIINRNKSIKTISNSVLTFYSLTVGAIVFLIKAMSTTGSVTTGISGIEAWVSLTGLALLPTVVSTATLAIATRNIGATKASVLGVFEPITAILIGTIVFGEPLTGNIVGGIMISVVAVTIMILTTKR